MVEPRAYSGASHFREAPERWGPVQDPDGPDLAAAWLQYRVARLIWAEIDSGRQTLKSIGELLGQSSESQRRKLAGEQVASLRDLLAWVMLSGYQAFEALPTEDDDLFPQAYLPMIRGWRSGRWKLPNLVPDVSTPDWPAAIERLGREVAAEVQAGMDHLITAQSLQYLIAHALADTSTRAESIRLLEMPGRGFAALVVGSAKSELVVVTVIDEVEIRSVTGAQSEVWRLRSILTDLGQQSFASPVLIAVAGRLGSAVLDEAWPRIESATRGSALRLGPFDSVDERGDARNWWVNHTIDIELLSRFSIADYELCAVKVGKSNGIDG